MKSLIDFNKYLKRKLVELEHIDFHPNNHPTMWMWDDNLREEIIKFYGNETEWASQATKYHTEFRNDIEEKPPYLISQVYKSFQTNYNSLIQKIINSLSSEIEEANEPKIVAKSLPIKFTTVKEMFAAQEVRCDTPEKFIDSLKFNINYLDRVGTLDTWHDVMLTHFIEYYGESSKEIDDFKQLLELFHKHNRGKSINYIMLAERDYKVKFKEFLRRIILKVEQMHRPRSIQSPPSKVEIVNPKSKRKNEDVEHPERKYFRFSQFEFYSILGLIVIIVGSGLAGIYTLGKDNGAKADDIEKRDLRDSLKNRNDSIAKYKAQLANYQKDRDTLQKRISEAIEVIGQYKPEQASPINANIIKELEELKITAK